MVTSVCGTEDFRCTVMSSTLNISGSGSLCICLVGVRLVGIWIGSYRPSYTVLVVYIVVASTYKLATIRSSLHYFVVLVYALRQA